MIRQRVLLQPAYLLHQRAYRDTSLLIEILALEYGRLGLIAKGARRPKSGLRAMLQPFVPLLISWTGRGELPTVTAVEGDACVWTLQGDALLCGFYLNELVFRLSHRYDPHDRLFEQYATSVAALAAGVEPGPVLRQFELVLLQEIGYGLMLDYDVITGEPIESEQLYVYLPDRGPTSRVAGNEAYPRVSGYILIALRHNDWTDSRLAVEVKPLLRSVLAFHLGDRPLKSRLLFRRQSNGRPKGLPPEDDARS